MLPCELVRQLGNLFSTSILSGSLEFAEYQFPLMDGHDHVVVAGYSLFTDSQRFHRDSHFPRSLPAALGLKTPTLPGTQAYARF